jgi:hypothetical protein
MFCKCLSVAWVFRITTILAHLSGTFLGDPSPREAVQKYRLSTPCVIPNSSGNPVTTLPGFPLELGMTFSDSLNKRKRGAKPPFKISIEQLAFNQGGLRKLVIIQQYHSDGLKKRQSLVMSVTLQLTSDVGFL